MTGFDRVGLARILSDGARGLPLGLGEEQFQRLIARLMDYLALLTKWNGVYNLTAVRDPAQMVTQHLLDSLAAVPAFAGAQHVLDVGAGGGLPGIVLALWADEAYPAMRVSLIDTVHKKTAFLTQVKVELGLARVTVYTSRVEQLQVADRFDVITSRAFADLSDFVTWSGHLLQPDGRFIALKGVAPQDELTHLPRGWRVSEVRPLKVPTLDAQRHLIFIERAA